MSSIAQLSPDTIANGTSAICLELSAAKSPLLPILNRAQARFGYIPESSIPIIANHLNLPHADIHSAINMYGLLTDKANPQRTIYICCAEACQASGANELLTYAEQQLHVLNIERREIKLAPAYCLGNCACGPSVMVGQKIYAKVNKKRFIKIIATVDN